LKQTPATASRGRQTAQEKEPVTDEWKSKGDEESEEEEHGGDDDPTTDGVMLTAEEWTMMQQLHNEHAQRAALVEQLQSEAEERRMQMEKMKQTFDTLEQQRIDEDARSAAPALELRSSQLAPSCCTLLSAHIRIANLSSCSLSLHGILLAHSH
jgi:hypothetical protein